MKATAKDLRINSKLIIETVERGEEVTLTYRGIAIAVIVPIKGKKDGKAKDLKESQLFGIWADHKPSKDVGQYVRKMRKGRFSDAG